MRRIAALPLLPLFGWSLLLAAGCSDTTAPVNPGANGGTAGTMAAAGASAGGSTSGGSGTGGAQGGSAAGVAGSSGGSSGGATAGGGAGGASGAGGSGGAQGHVPVPSAGCGKLNPMDGARTIQTGGQTANFNVNLPDGYDANKPMPLGFGFHGFGNDECGPDQGECRGFKALPAVTVYMKSLADGWEQSRQGGPLSESERRINDEKGGLPPRCARAHPNTR